MNKNRILVRWLSLLLGLMLSTAATNAAAMSNELTAELVRQRLKTPNAEDDAPIREAYLSVARWLEQLAAHQQSAESYDQQAAQAETQVTAIQARLDALEQTGAPQAATFKALTLTQLDRRLISERAQNAETSNELDAVDRQMQSREANAELMYTRLNTISKRLPELGTATIAVNIQAAPTLLEASQWNILAERLALSAERRALNAQLASQPARYSVLQIQQVELEERLTRHNTTITLVETELDERDKRGETITYISIAPDRPAYSVAETMAQHTATLRRERVRLIHERTTISAHRSQLHRQTRVVSERFATARRMVTFGGDSDALGHVLMTHWREIDQYDLQDPTTELATAIGNTVISRIEHEEALAGLANTANYIDQALADAEIPPSDVSRTDDANLAELARKERDQLSILITNESAFIDASMQLEDEYQRLAELTVEYQHFLAGLIFWIPSHPPLHKANFATIPAEAAKLLDSRPDVDLQQIRLDTLLILLGALILLQQRRNIRRAWRTLGDKINRPREDTIGYTLRALLLTLLMTLPLPLLMLGIGGVFATGSSALSQAIASSLDHLVTFTFVLLLVRHLCEKNGAGRAHFGWSDAVCDRLQRETTLFVRFAVPLQGLTLVLQLIEIDDYQAIIGRLSYLATLALLMGRIGWLMIRRRRQQKTTVALWVHLGALLACGVAIIAVAIGHVYSVNILLAKVLATLAIGVALVIVHGVLLRWLNIARRRLRMAELIAYRSGTDTEVSPASKVGLSELSDTSAQLLLAGTIAAGAVAVLRLWAPLLPMLTVLDKVTLWSTTTLVDGEALVIPITLQTLAEVILLACATFYAAHKLPALIQLLLRQHTQISASARYTVTTLVNYVIVGSGLLLALGALGLKWSQLQWLVAALGVGIGFGLQEIVANFISGLIILFERPIRVGDVVTVGGQEGTVTRIRIRATTIKDWDSKELLVPNKDFITSQLLNWTLSDQVTRIVIKVGITYGSDVEHALTLLQALINEHPEVIDDPPSRVLFTELGDNALILVVRCFINSVDDRMKVISELHRTIYARFNAADIDFAFPQLDVHLDKDLPGPMTTTVNG